MQAPNPVVGWLCHYSGGSLHQYNIRTGARRRAQEDNPYMDMVINNPNTVCNWYDGSSDELMTWLRMDEDYAAWFNDTNNHNIDGLTYFKIRDLLRHDCKPGRHLGQPRARARQRPGLPAPGRRVRAADPARDAAQQARQLIFPIGAKLTATCPDSSTALERQLFGGKHGRHLVHGLVRVGAPARHGRAASTRRWSTPCKTRPG